MFACRCNWSCRTNVKRNIRHHQFGVPSFVSRWVESALIWQNSSGASSKKKLNNVQSSHYSLFISSRFPTWICGIPIEPSHHKQMSAREPIFVHGWDALACSFSCMVSHLQVHAKVEARKGDSERKLTRATHNRMAYGNFWFKNSTLLVCVKTLTEEGWGMRMRGDVLIHICTQIHTIHFRCTRITQSERTNHVHRIPKKAYAMARERAIPPMHTYMHTHTARVQRNRKDERESENLIPNYMPRNVICILHFICASHRQHETRGYGLVNGNGFIGTFSGAGGQLMCMAWRRCLAQEWWIVYRT